MPIPDWLEPYASTHDAARAALTTSQQVLFDGLWNRALGRLQPALSGRERERLIEFLNKGEQP